MTRTESDQLSADQLPTIEEMRAVYPSGLFRAGTDDGGVDSRTLRRRVTGDGS